MKCLTDRLFTVATALTLLMSAEVYAGNESVAKMALNAARSNLESSYFEQSQMQLDKAVEATEGLDDAVKGPILIEVEALRGELAAAILKDKQARSVETIESYIRSVESEIDDDRGLGDRYDESLQRADNALMEQSSTLERSDVERLRARLDAVRTRGDAAHLIDVHNAIDDEFNDVERAFASGDFDSAERGLNEIETMLESVPADDSRAIAAAARIATLRGDIASTTASQRKQANAERAEPAIMAWQELLKNNAAADDETAPNLEAFRISSSIGEATIRRIRDIDNWFDWHGQTLSDLPDDADLQAIGKQARQLRDDDAEKLCELLLATMAMIDKLPVGERDGQYDAAQQIVSAADSLAEYTSDAPSREKLVAEAKRYSEKWIGERTAAETAAGEEWDALTEKAHQTWAGWEKDFPAEEFYPLDCVKNFDACKGRTIMLRNLSDRARWDYRDTGLGPICPVNGSPVAFKLPPEIREAANALNAEIGYHLSDQDIYALAGVVKGTMTVERIEYDRVTEQHYVTATVEVPLVEVVAYASGPLAARVGHSGTGGGAGAGGGGWIGRLLGTALCLLGGVACLARARTVLVPQMAGIEQIETKIGKQNLDYIGLALSLLGFLWLLYGLIYRDLLPAVALVAAGVYLAQDFLLQKGVLKDVQVARLRPLGALVGLACVALGVLHLFLGGFPLV